MAIIGGSSKSKCLMLLLPCLIPLERITQQLTVERRLRTWSNKTGSYAFLRMRNIYDRTPTRAHTRNMPLSSLFSLVLDRIRNICVLYDET